MKLMNYVKQFYLNVHQRNYFFCKMLKSKTSLKKNKRSELVIQHQRVQIIKTVTVKEINELCKRN
jgi:hypothetical protein